MARLFKCWRFLIHLKRAVLYFFVSAWFGVRDSFTKAGLRELATVLGILAAVMTGVGAFSFLTLVIAICTSRSFQFRYDLKWSTWGQSVLITMMVAVFAILAFLVFMAIIRPIYSHWSKAWYETSSRARAIRLMQ